MKRVKVGIIGCGAISDVYFWMMGQVYKDILDLCACGDLMLERAQAKAEKNPGVKAMTVKQLLKDPEIEIVVNLTIPRAHAKVAFDALKAGKSVYNEKPLAITRKEGLKMLALAAEKGLRVGGAPDTFLGGGIQTCRKLIEEGAIGTPVAATAFMLCHGHESWHPSPEFYYDIGGGPMFDMGPYYLTALVNLLGPVQRVTGSARVTFPTRTITSQPKNGTVIEVKTPTHLAGVMDFANGAVGTIIQSFDVWGHSLPCIEIYGSEGSLSVPDPNGFGGTVRVAKPGQPWQEVPLSFQAEINRGTGVADMALGIRDGRPHRANGDLCYHVLDLMHAFHDASAKGRHVAVKSTCAKPLALKPGVAFKGLGDTNWIDYLTA